MLYDIVKLNMKECTFQSLYEAIPTEAETQLLFRVAITERKSDEEIICILPWTTNTIIDKASEDYKLGQALAEKYKAMGLKRHAFSLAEYAKVLRRKENG